MTTPRPGATGQDVIIDPDLPELDRQLLRRAPAVLIPASHPAPTPGTPPRNPGSIAGITVAAVFALVSGAIGVLNATRGDPTGGAFGTAVISCAIAVWAFARGRRRASHAQRAARTHHGRYLVVSQDFDTQARALLRRAEKAYISVLSSPSVQEHVLDDIDLTQLPRQFYQLACLLHIQSRMRAHMAAAGPPHDEQDPQGAADPREDLRHSVEQADHGTRELEELADKVTKIDARLAWARREDTLARQRETARDAAAETHLALARATRYQELVNGDLTPIVRRLEAMADATEEEQ